MGGQAVELDFKRKPPVIILMMGLQGSGKTTTCGKLAFRLKAEGKRPLWFSRYSKTCCDSAAQDGCKPSRCRML